MNAVQFDTLAYVKELESHGVVPEQAQGHIKAVTKILAPNFVTKREQQQMVDTLSQQTQLLGVGLRAEMTELKTELKSDITNLKVDLIKWGLTIAFGQAALIVSLLKLIH